MEGFEPSHRLPGLPHFECGPFSLLGTSPYFVKYIIYYSAFFGIRQWFFRWFPMEIRGLYFLRKYSKVQLTQTNNLPQAASHPDAASSFILSLLPPSSSLLFSSFLHALPGPVLSFWTWSIPYYVPEQIGRLSLVPEQIGRLSLVPV